MTIEQYIIPPKNIIQTVQPIAQQPALAKQKQKMQSRRQKPTIEKHDLSN
jgi:hypothetical protein